MKGFLDFFFFNKNYKKTIGTILIHADVALELSHFKNSQRQGNEYKIKYVVLPKGRFWFYEETEANNITYLYKFYVLAAPR